MFLKPYNSVTCAPMALLKLSPCAGSEEKSQ